MFAYNYIYTSSYFIRKNVCIKYVNYKLVDYLDSLFILLHNNERSCAIKNPSFFTFKFSTIRLILKFMLFCVFITCTEKCNVLIKIGQLQLELQKFWAFHKTIYNGKRIFCLANTRHSIDMSPTTFSSYAKLRNQAERISVWLWG